MMPRALRSLLLAAATAACFIGFWFGSLLLSWAILPLARLPLRRRPPIERIRRCQDVVGWGFRLFLASMRVLRLVEFRPGRVKLDLPDGPYLMIANHPTLVDVTAVMAVQPRICCVAKTELFHSVLVGRLLRYSGHIEGGDLESLGGACVAQQALERLAGGQAVLIFPEGTRSPARGLRRFKPGVFAISIRAKVPIVPVLITCEPPTLLKGQAWYALPKTTAAYDITQLPTVQPGALGHDAGAAAALFQRMFRERIESGSARPSTATGIAAAALTGGLGGAMPPEPIEPWKTSRVS